MAAPKSVFRSNEEGAAYGRINAEERARWIAYHNKYPYRSFGHWLKDAGLDLQSVLGRGQGQSGIAVAQQNPGQVVDPLNPDESRRYIEGRDTIGMNLAAAKRAFDEFMNFELPTQTALIERTAVQQKDKATGSNIGRGLLGSGIQQSDMADIESARQFNIGQLSSARRTAENNWLTAQESARIAGESLQRWVSQGGDEANPTIVGASGPLVSQLPTNIPKPAGAGGTPTTAPAPAAPSMPARPNPASFTGQQQGGSVNQPFVPGKTAGWYPGAPRNVVITPTGPVKQKPKPKKHEMGPGRHRY